MNTVASIGQAGRRIDGQLGGQTAGGWDADDYGRNARFVADLAASLVDRLDPKPGERILDLGCGDGELTLAIARRGARVTGLDSSPDFVKAARGRGLHAVIGDAQRLDSSPEITGPYDAVFSNAALHWMKYDPRAVIDGVFARLAPGGRFVAEFGGAGNVAPIRAALRAEAQTRGKNADELDPWFFPEEKAYVKQLCNAGFSINHQETFARPTPLPGDMTAWLETLARPFVHAFAAGNERGDYLAAVRERLASAMQDDTGRWTAPYVRLRFAAFKDAQATA